MTTFQKWTVGLLVVLLVISIGMSTYLIKQSSSKSTTNESKDSPAMQSTEDKKIEQAKFALQQYNYSKAQALLKDEQSSQAKELNKKIETNQQESIKWEDPEKISHLFFHSLIVDPQKAFHDKEQAKGYRDYMVTISEFNKSIQQLYDKGYVLVDFQDLLTKKEDELKFTGVRLPKGKKPLILSQDDVSYYEYMAGAGFADKLLLDTKGSV